MDETKILLSTDNMATYEELKKNLENNPNEKIQIIDYGRSFTQEFIAYTDEYIRYYYSSYIVRFSVKGVPYLKQNESKSFKFNKISNKISAVNIKSFMGGGRIIKMINELLHVEWFNDFTNNNSYNGIYIDRFYNKTILENVWGKKITNPEALIKFYSKRILHLKNISWKYLKLFLCQHNKSSFFDSNFNLQIIDNWVNNPNLFINNIVKINSRNSFSDYNDYLRQIAILNIKSNVANWSMKRFQTEHQKINLKLIERELANKDNTLIFSDEYNKYLPDNINCYFINNEQKCFAESKTMSHCIYFNYWSSISEFTYFAIAIDDKTYGRATVGIRTNRDGSFLIDQIRGPHNSSCNQELITIFNDWIANNQELFKKLSLKNDKYVDLKKKSYNFALSNEKCCEYEVL